jgi:chemotaxis protein methyltransferase CheR
MSVAAVQSHLHSVDGIERINIAAYLAKLGAGLAASMIGPHHGIELKVASDDEGTLQSGEAVSLGLIVTELVINAIKYAFPTAPPGALILVTFESREGSWKLAVADNGTGRVAGPAGGVSGGLGTAIVAALAKQLHAEIREVSTGDGLCIELTRAAPAKPMPIAA